VTDRPRLVAMRLRDDDADDPPPCWDCPPPAPMRRLADAELDARLRDDPTRRWWVCDQCGGVTLDTRRRAR